MAKRNVKPPQKQRSKNVPPADLSGNDPNHILGKRCGATITADGLCIAPSWQERFDDLLERQETVTSILAFQQQLAEQSMSAVKKATRNLWQQLAEEYDLDLSLGYFYRRATGEVIRHPNGPAKMESPKIEEDK